MVALALASKTCQRQAPNACIYLISGSFSLPCLGSFHLSLTVLSTLSVIEKYLDLEGGPPIFKQG
jgi:hypothetical protein